VKVVLKVPVIAMSVTVAVEVAVSVIMIVVGKGVFVEVENTTVLATIGFLETVTVFFAVGMRAIDFVPICVLQIWEVVVLGGFAATPLLKRSSAERADRMKFGMVELETRAWGCVFLWIFSCWALPILLYFMLSTTMACDGPC
jgi:hypothetical protein